MIRPQGARCDIGSYELRNPPRGLNEEASGKNVDWGDSGDDRLKGG
jgi:hypothetical protein